MMMIGHVFAAKIHLQQPTTNYAKHKKLPQQLCLYI